MRRSKATRRRGGSPSGGGMGAETERASGTPGGGAAGGGGSGKRPESSCRHCGLPVPRGARHPEFCCPGCEAVHRILREESLTEFYRLGGGRGRPVGAVPRPEGWDWLDECLERGDSGGGIVRLTLDIQGIHCAACVWVLQETWRRSPGALAIELNPSLGQARLSFDRRRLDPRDWFRTLAALGYRVGPASKRVSAADRSLLVRMGVCIALAMNAMVFALAGYLGLEEAGGPIRELFRWISLGLATLAFLCGGPVFFRPALAGLRRRVLHLDLPIALGILLGYGGSLLWFFLRGGHAYFDTLTIFIALMLVGRFLQERALRKNRDLLLAEEGLDHLRATRLEEEGPKKILIAALAPGDLLLLVPGGLCPVRGRLVGGPARFSLDWIDGESEARSFEEGAEIPAGAFLAGRKAVKIRVLADVEDSGIGDLLRERRGGEGEGPAAGRFWDRVNRFYVRGVLLAALAGFLLWLRIDPARSWEIMVSILVVTCPCALGLATPLAFEFALARLRRLGVFVKRTDLFERCRSVSRILFDKTGTLTWGGLRARPLLRCQPGHLDVLATMAESSGHPASLAIAALCRAEGAGFLPDLKVEEIPGSGLRCRFDGVEFRLGSPAFCAPGASAEDADCVFAAEGHRLASFRLEEDFREGFDRAIRKLEREGREVHLLSGDSPAKVARAAERLGLDPARAAGGLSPFDKAERIRRIGRERCMMIGDGLNDAPAFREALCSGTPALDRPVLPSRADFFYLGNGAGAVEAVLETAENLHRTVRANLRFAFAYNLGALAACFAGWMTPLLCAIAMPTSSLLLLAQVFHRLGPRPARGSSGEGR